MSSLIDTAAALADDTILIMEKSGEDRLHYAVADLLGKSSQTLEEAYLTEVRVRLAGKAAREFLRGKAEELVATNKTETPKP
ncbi:hypothetical protein KO498_10880 [Lentibacter algarum]|uniref:hypothetical protein n=1 Tax=Lentibacter algarum TaxID=576131 RepID=UPI001C0766DC|nr:hypothetical protein [Lentibacter algarum]MBU2982311.1 hypothetical protein [Lentibacter algarum]